MEHISPLLQALIDNLGESAAVGVLAILGMFRGRITNWWKDRAIKAFERGINQNVRLRELLSELRVPYKADRVCLYQFHNGDYYHSGESIMKCSLTHFVTKIGVANPTASLNLPSTQMIMSLKALQDHPTVPLLYDTFTDDNFLESLFTDNGTYKAMATTVRDTRRNWIGILCVSWMSDPGPAVTGESLLSYSRQIGEFLSRKT